MEMNRRQWLAAAPASASALVQAQDRISLAQWSFNRSFRAGVWKNLDMPRIVREKAGLDALEFVNLKTRRSATCAGSRRAWPRRA